MTQLICNRYTAKGVGRDCNIPMRITDRSGRETQTDILEQLFRYCWIFVYI